MADKAEILGQVYDLAYTLEVHKKISEKMGGSGAEEIEKLFEPVDMGEYYNRMAWLGRAMIEAAENRKYVMAHLSGDSYKKIAAPTEEEMACMGPREASNLAVALMTAMRHGNTSRIELEPQKKSGEKNGKRS